MQDELEFMSCSRVVEISGDWTIMLREAVIDWLWVGTACNDACGRDQVVFAQSLFCLVDY